MIISNIGLPNYIRSKTLENLIYNECNGLRGAIRCVVTGMREVYFKPLHDISETDLMLAYLSYNITSKMERCFGGGNLYPLRHETRRYLQNFFFNDSITNRQDLNESYKSELMQLEKSGILTNDRGAYKWTSLMAKRYFNGKIFPHRSDSGIPNTLKELIMDSLKLMSSSLLKKSKISNEFPKEATFQHLFMNALAACTPIDCQIYPEFSEIFPDLDNPSIKKIDGAIDFYIDGDLRWGIELLVKGDRIRKRIDRFSEDGKYNLLKVNDYVVLDFRPGNITKIDLHDKRITVFFFDETFSNCKCIIGNDRNPINISLSG